MNYYTKYLKYKTKYNNLKGGFGLIEECSTFNPEKFKDLKNETNDHNDHKDNFLYSKLSRIFNNPKYNSLLQYVQYIYNNKSGPTIYNTIEEFYSDVKEIFDLHDDILLELVLSYMKSDDNSNYHIQHSALIFISFIIELELFILLYGLIPYNTPQKPNNNFFRMKWNDSSVNNKIMYNNIQDNILNIQDMLKYYLCTLEYVFKKVVTQLYIITGIDGLSDYKHIDKNWYTKAKELIPNLDNIIYSSINDISTDDAMIYSLFHFVFENSKSLNCLGKSMIEVYILTRLRIDYSAIAIGRQNHNPHKYKFVDTYIHDGLCTSHWFTHLPSFLNRYSNKFKDQDLKFLKLTEKNKIFFTFIFTSYDIYSLYFEYSKIFNKSYYNEISELIYDKRIHRFSEYIDYFLILEPKIIQNQNTIEKTIEQTDQLKIINTGLHLPSQLQIIENK
jgi:hypothetical protein